jgi:hypothetical protein
MTRKGFATLDQLRGLLSVPTGTDEGVHERLGYVSAMREANRSLYGP